MQELYNCLQNIIGLSDTSCDCWDASKPGDFATLNASESELYISMVDTIPVETINTFINCESGVIWTMLDNARKKGIKAFVGGFFAMLQTRLEQKRESVVQYIGTDIKNDSLTPVYDFQGQYYEPKYFKSGYMTIDKVQLALSNITPPVNVDVEVYSSKDLTNLLGTTTVTLTANSQFAEASFSTPVQIDLSTVRDDLDEKVYIVYQLPAGARPVNNEMTEGCNTCGGGYTKDLSRNEYLKWVCEANGIESTAVANLNSVNRINSYARGLRVHTTFNCDWWSWLCDISTNPNTVTLGLNKVNLGLALAETIQAASVASVYDFLINSPSINRHSITNSDVNLYAMRGHWQKKVKQYTAFLVDRMPENVSDCLRCKDKGRLKMSKVY